MKPFLGDLLFAETLLPWVQRLGGKPFNVNQIHQAYFQAQASFQQITALPIALRERLSEQIEFFTACPVTTTGSNTEAEKILFEFSDRQRVESVLIHEPPRITACLSTQVGCAAGCLFCASGLNGVKRSLSATEIIDQFLRMKRTLPKQAAITNVVIMGMGEPFLNYDATLEAIRRLNAPDGCGIGARRITVSTVGIPSRIRAFANEPLQVNLAISLHAANDALRDRIVPLNKKYPIRKVISAAQDYFDTTGREVTFEYILLDEVNASPDDAEQLAVLLRGVRGSVNLIPYNAVEGLPWRAPAPEACEGFRQRLLSLGVNATTRKRKGNRYAAACGQLRLDPEGLDRP